MTPAGRKKAKNIARKMQKKKAKAAVSAANGESGKKDDKNGGKKKTKPHVIDEDPEGKELPSLDHLEEAKKYASLLVCHAPKRMSAWALQYDVSVRRGEAPGAAGESTRCFSQIGLDFYRNVVQLGLDTNRFNS